MEINLYILPAVVGLLLYLIYHAVNLTLPSSSPCLPIRSIFSTPSVTFSSFSSFSEKSRRPNEPPPPPSSTDHRDTLPPSTRDALAEVIRSLPPDQRKQFGSWCSPPLSHAEILANSPPFDTPFEQWGPKDTTPTGITAQEIRALGDFPDHARLSGVRLPSPYPDFDIHRALPRPYRPLRWAYHQTMSLTKLEPDWWLELEKTYVTRVAQRNALFAQHGRAVLDYLPGSEQACKEYFSLSPDKTVLRNAILDTETDLQETIHPLHVLLRNIPEDFAVMMRDPRDGVYYLRAGVLCSSLGWHLGTKLSLPLAEIHGPIPDYREKMRVSMDRYFAKLPPSRPVQRGSWGLEIDQPLFMPPGDPHSLLRLTQDPSLALSRVHLRVDWQTLRRLPISGAIVFNFKALFTPVTGFRNEPYIPSLLKKILLEGKQNLMAYKDTWHVEHVVLPALEEWEREQVRKGWVERDWDVRTLDETPWFPGWKEKWLAMQGFGG
ncbi:MAG: hypothetical protein M1816_007577 [Peltula sp. TS41687]|nr:MAG: hypothetical protein M1816_007577 [Peltula sp. TS41687]